MDFKRAVSEKNTPSFKCKHTAVGHVCIGWSPLKPPHCFSQGAFLLYTVFHFNPQTPFCTTASLSPSGKRRLRVFPVEPANTTLNSNSCCLLLPCAALICSCSAESRASLCSGAMGRGVYISLKWTDRAGRLQTAAVFTSCYPMAQTDRPTKDDKAEECRSLKTAVWCARLLEPLEICRVSVWSTPCTEGLYNPAQFAPLDYYTAAHNAYMHSLWQSFLLVSRKKKSWFILQQWPKGVWH